MSDAAIRQPEGRNPTVRRPETILETLDRGECLQLLATQRVGRLAVAEPGRGPHVVPVNYTMLRDSVILRSAPGTKLTRLVTEPVTFEVDCVDSFLRMGWSVVIEGLAYEASDWEIEAEGIHLAPFVDRQNSRWVRLVPRSITGRRVTERRTYREGNGEPNDRSAPIGGVSPTIA